LCIIDHARHEACVRAGVHQTALVDAGGLDSAQAVSKIEVASFFSGTRYMSAEVY